MKPSTPPTPPAAAGDILELAITDVAYRGAGIARVGGWVVFVPGALPGEQIRARLTRCRRQFGEAELVAVLAAAPARCAPACPLSGTCPGCAYQAVAYPAEVRLKQAQLAHFLAHAAGVAPDACAPPLASPQALHYRNKITLHGDTPAGRRVLGYFAADNTTILDVPACPLALPPINARLAALRADAAFMAAIRPHLALTLRHTEADGVVHWAGHPDANAPWLHEASPLGPLLVPRGSFFQVNPGAAALLLARARDCIRELAPQAVVDLYCGVGVFALLAAQAGVPRVRGVDSDGPAIRAAARNAQALGCAVDFQHGAAQGAARAALSGLPAAHTLLVVDPPRAGLTRALIADIVRAAPAGLLYVSCAADTLARDLGALTAGGYRVARAQLVDMFPRTPYFETLTLLRR